MAHGDSAGSMGHGAWSKGQKKNRWGHVFGKVQIPGFEPLAAPSGIADELFDIAERNAPCRFEAF
jgi:hypothetical protein